MSKYMIAAISTQREFGRAAHPDTNRPVREQRKRKPPVSVRFSDDELAALKEHANGEPLGSYIKSKVFDGTPVTPKRSVIQDYELLAQVLATLGQSKIFANLDTIAKAIENGDLELSVDQQESIALACLLVFEIRDDVIRALGLKPR
jgi:hypothetical protein